MPVRFSCEQCGQKLSVKDEKAGMPVRCPKCHAKQIVPQPHEAETAGVSTAGGGAAQQATSQGTPTAPVPPPPPPGSGVGESLPGEPPREAGSPPASPPATEESGAAAAGSALDLSSIAADDQGGEEGDMFAEFAVYDESAEWVYEEDSEQQESLASATPKHYVAVPRNILYVQGGLLVALAIFGFVFGFLSGRLSVDPSQANNTARPATVSIVVLYHNDEGNEVNDPRALVLIVPADQPPEEKLSRIGMSPGDPTLPDNHETFARLKVMGGYMARTNSTGRCTLRVPRQGSYYIVCISENAQVEGGAKPEDVAILGNYVMESFELLDGTAYQIRQRNVMGNTNVSFRFP